MAKKNAPAKTAAAAMQRAEKVLARAHDAALVFGRPDTCERLSRLTTAAGADLVDAEQALQYVTPAQRKRSAKRLRWLRCRYQNLKKVSNQCRAVKKQSNTNFTQAELRFDKLMTAVERCSKRSPYLRGVRRTKRKR